MSDPHNGILARKNIVPGQVYGYLTVVKFAEAGGLGRHHKWECMCVCGVTKDVSSSSLRRGNTKSCGCRGRVLNNPAYLRALLAAWLPLRVLADNADLMKGVLVERTEQAIAYKPETRKRKRRKS